MEPKQNKCAIYILSDIHMETYDNKLSDIWCIKEVKSLLDHPPSDPEAVLILAGDIGRIVTNTGEPNTCYINFLTKMREIFKYVILVAGNHEFRVPGWSIKKMDCELESLCEDLGVVYLQRKTWIHPMNGVTFCGCTLWSKISLAESKKSKDRAFIFKSYKNMINAYKTDVAWLRSRINRIKGPIIIITHYTPSYKCIIGEYLLYNCDHTTQYSNLEYLIKHPVVAWFCGHTHSDLYTRHNGIPIIMNSIGYPREPHSLGSTTMRSGPYLLG